MSSPEYSRFSRCIRAFGAIALLLGATACSSSLTRFDLPPFGETTSSVTPPAAVGYGNSTPQATSPGLPTGEPPASSSPVAPSPYRDLSGGFSEITVRENDTLYGLSRRYGISERNILAANNLDSAADVKAGTKLVIPPVTYRPGQAVPQSVSSNSINSQPLAAPGSSQTPSRVASAAPTTGGTPQFHTVQSGETAYGISRRYGMTVSQLASRNGLDASNKVRIGQRLAIAAPGRAAAATPAAAPTPTRTATAIPAPSPRPRHSAQNSGTQVASLNATPVSTTPVPAARPTATRSVPATPPVRRASNNSPLPEPDAMSSSQFRWPVRGRIISPFGTKPNGASNDGINISVPEGTSVKAAENGVVAYAGNELAGYGNLVLIRHQNDFVTAYAHNSEILVQRGDKVRRGQVIARAGQSGSVDKPQVHFEVRQASRPIDPIPHMAGS